MTYEKTREKTENVDVDVFSQEIEAMDAQMRLTEKKTVGEYLRRTNVATAQTGVLSTGVVIEMWERLSAPIPVDDTTA